MKSDVTIRKAANADLDAIGRLWQEFMDFHRDRDPHFARSADGHERFKEFIAGHITSDTSCVLVADDGGEIVGYCLATLAKYPPVFEHRDYGAVFDLAGFLYSPKRARQNRFQSLLPATLRTYPSLHPQLTMVRPRSTRSHDPNPNPKREIRAIPGGVLSGTLHAGARCE